MIKALIVDDELKARNVLDYYIKNFTPDITEVQQASSVADAERILQEFKPDVLFLDIEMPHQNGFALLQALENPAFDIIFTTAYNQYAIQAIRFSALDYLLKPIDPDELVSAVNRLLDKQESSKQKEDLYKNLIRNIEKKNTESFRLAVPFKGGIHFFNASEIIHIRADGNYSVIYLEGKREFLSCKTLGLYEQMLEDSDFIRTHKSHLVNVKHISYISNNHEYLMLTNGSQVEIARRKKKEILQYVIA